jgi:hypothetical protein
MLVKRRIIALKKPASLASNIKERKSPCMDDSHGIDTMDQGFFFFFLN